MPAAKVYWYDGRSGEGDPGDNNKASPKGPRGTAMLPPLLLELKKKDFETIKAKYDADRKRYFELTRRPPATSGAATPGR